MENCTCAFDANLSFVGCRLTLLTSGMRFNDDSYHGLNTVGEPLSFSCQHVVGHEDSSVTLAIGCKDSHRSRLPILTPSACMLSWVMVRRNSLSIYMIFGLVSGEVLSCMDGGGSLSLRAWIGEGLSLSGYGLRGMNYFSPGLY